MKTKAVAIPSSLSAALGITEPAIFGVNLRLVKPLVFGIAGGAAGSLVGAFFKIGATSYGVTGIPGFLITLDYTFQYVILLAVSFVVAFGLTWVFWKEENETETKEEVKKEEENDNSIYAPIKGNVIARDQIPDPTFASGMLGEGVGIEPAMGEVVAPFDGTVAIVMDSKHAVAVVGNNGMELLIHVGIDTVNMNGDGFKVFAEAGQKVYKGQKLLEFDIEKIKKAGYSPVTAVLVSNSADYPEFKVVKTGKIEKLEKIITV